jgi:RNA polymerase sigma-70 factor (ECF subfamily)
MEDNKINELFTQIYNEYSLKLLRWVNKKVDNKEDAEDIVQEIFIQILKAIKKNTIREETLNNYIWKIAYYTWCKHLRDKIYPNKPIELEDDGERFTKVSIEKMRKDISKLNYLHREALIMKYLENKPIKDIAQKLNITENYVYKLLFDAKKKVITENETMKDETEYVYRPYELQIGVAGEPGDSPDYVIIQNCILKQNICVACYHTPRNLNELSGYLGISKAYVEIELNWLIEREYLEKRQDKYYTTFFIENHDDTIRIANVYFRNKASFSDKLIDQLIDKQETIKKIGFHGSNEPIEKLLWFLINSFIEYATEHYCKKQNLDIEPPIKHDNAKYNILGRVHTEPTIEYKAEFLEKYEDFYHGLNYWQIDWAEGGNEIKSFGVNSPFDENLLNFAVNTSDTHVISMRNMFMRLAGGDIDIESLSEDDRVNLSKMISYGWFTLEGRGSEKGEVEREEGVMQGMPCETIAQTNQEYPISHTPCPNRPTPNFAVFSIAQRKELNEIYSQIYAEMNDDINTLAGELKKAIKDMLPIQLDYFKDYALYVFMSLGQLYAMRYAFLDDKLYKPENEEECALLALNVTVNR